MIDSTLLRLLLVLVCVGLANQADQRGHNMGAVMWGVVAGVWLFAMVLSLLGVVA